MKTSMLALAAGFAAISLSANAAELTVYATGSMELPMHIVGEAFTHATGHTLKFELGTTGVVLNKLKTGKADVIVISSEAAERLEKEGRIVVGTRNDVANSLLGIGIKKGTKAPNISTPEAFKQAILAARSISYPDPKLGATSGVYIEEMFAKMGIADAARRKTTVKPVGKAVADAVVSGEIELGLTFMSEFKANDGVTIVGPFPGNTQNPTLYTAGVASESANKDAARAFVAYTTSRDQSVLLLRAGVDPVH
ncbi:MAG: extracellular solute-binding protein [Alphaproteobacteria bacterium]|nr:extracellular solute-binding protein [Alphaproteobacteria bacterium]